MPITRRQFLKRATLATAGTVMAPSLFGNPWVRKAFADTIGDRYLVILFLDGGNDGLNTIVPIGNEGGLRAAYDLFRTSGGGGINIAPGALSVPSLAMNDPNTGAALGFHPGLASLATMYDAGDLAVIQGCGYPDYSLSHDEARVIWQSGNPLGVGTIASTGWCGRHLAFEYGPTDIPAVTIDNVIARELRQFTTSVLAIPRLSRFGFPFDDYDEDDIPLVDAAYVDMHAQAAGSDQELVALLGNAGKATADSTKSYPPLDSLYTTDRAAWNSAYSGLSSSTARDLREVAKIIYGVHTGQPGVAARFFQVDNGGYDTHADQGAGETNGRHYSLLAEVGDAIKLFFDDMNDMGIGNKVTMVVWSEFSRRIPQNSNGTDHGSQGPMFVIGEPVTGGIYGNHPNINEAALDNSENTVYSQDAGNGFRSTDFRDVFGTILKHWTNMSDANIQSFVLPLDTGPAADYWTVKNFDMGFL